MGMDQTGPSAADDRPLPHGRGSESGRGPEAPKVRVESPFPAAAWPRVWQWIADFRRSVADDFAPATCSAFVEQQLARAEHSRTWAVYHDAELCGLVAYEPVSPVTGMTHAMFRKDFWGHAITETALRMVYAEIFAGGARRIFGTPFTTNHASNALAMRLGFKKEGVLRKHTLRGGKPADMIVLGLLKEEFVPCPR